MSLPTQIDADAFDGIGQDVKNLYVCDSKLCSIPGFPGINSELWHFDKA